MAINFVDGKYVDEKGMLKLDPTVYKDWQIAEEAEKNLPPVDYFREKLGLLPEEITTMLQAICRQNNLTMEQLRDCYDQQLEDAVMQSVLTTKVLGLIRENATVTAV